MTGKEFMPFFSFPLFFFFCGCLVYITEGWIVMSSNKYHFWALSCNLSSEFNFPLNQLFMWSLNAGFGDKNKMWNDFCLRMSVFFISEYYYNALYQVLSSMSTKCYQIIMTHYCKRATCKRLFWEQQYIAVWSTLTSTSSQTISHIWYVCAYLRGHTQKSWGSLPITRPSRVQASSALALLVWSAPELKYPSLRNTLCHGDRLCCQRTIYDSTDFPKVIVLDGWQCLKKHMISFPSNSL